jgi:glycosyltransferase involved in cell wall biosynthesis
MVATGQDRRPGEVQVSAVIPCHNGDRYVAETIGSVLRQRCDRLEIILVDDGSIDRTREIVESMGPAVRYVRQTHGGVARARNGGAALASGAFLGFLDADDLWPDGALRALLAPFERDPELDMAVGHMEQFVSPELPEEARNQFRFSPDPVPARMCGSVLVRRSVFDRVGGFSTRLESGEFMDWILRAESLGVRSVTVPEVVLRRRLHRLNHGVVRRDARQDYVRVVKAALDRRRASAAQEPRG